MDRVDLNNWQSQIRKGLLDAVVLNFLRHGRCHGYELVQTLKKIEVLKIRESNIYPILARLETDGLVKCSQEQSQDGPPRKYYEITKSGEKAVDEMNRHLEQIMEGIRIIREGGCK